MTVVAERPGPDVRLPQAASVLAVCAHPDDESFGLGAVLDAYRRQGASTAVLSFTRGELSTLGNHPDQDLGALRAMEVRQAAGCLGVGRLRVLDHPDGALSSVAATRLEGEVAEFAQEVRADLLVVFDTGGITGHPDHQAATATATAVAAALGIGVLAWVIPEGVAAALNEEFRSGFVGRPPAEVDICFPVDRRAQRQAIACHVTQSSENPLLWRRLELQGAEEALRWLRRPP